MLNVISTRLPSLEKFPGEFKDLFRKALSFKNFKIYPFGLELRGEENQHPNHR